eukprot:456504_1
MPHLTKDTDLQKVNLIKQIKQQANKTKINHHHVNFGTDEAPSKNNCSLGKRSRSITHLLCSHDKNKLLRSKNLLQNAKFQYSVKTCSCVDEADYNFVRITTNFKHITNKATLINEYPTVDKYNKLQLQLLLCDMEKKTQKTVTELNIPFKLSTLSTIQSLRNQSTPKSTYNAWFSINDKANVFKDFNGYKIGMYWKDKNINTKQVKKKDESPVLIAVGKWNLTSKSKAPFDMVHIHKDRASDTEFGLIIDTSHARAKGAYKLKVKIITKKKKNVKDYLIFSCDYASCAVSNTNYSI